MAKEYLKNNEGVIVRPHGRPHGTFSVVPDSILLDTSLSARARLVIGYIAGRPPGWVATVTDIRRKLGLTESQWKSTRDELRFAGIVPTDHPKRVGGGVNKFTWILDLHLGRYYLPTGHPLEIADGSHQRFSMDGKAADYQNKLTKKKKPPPRVAAGGGKVVVHADQKRPLPIIEGFSPAETSRVHAPLAQATVAQIDLFEMVWKARRGSAADEVAMAVGLAQLASKGELKGARSDQPPAETEGAAAACARHARQMGAGEIVGPSGLIAIAHLHGDEGILRSPTGGVFPPAESLRLWRRVDTGALDFQPAR